MDLGMSLFLMFAGIALVFYALGGNPIINIEINKKEK